jgi:hypothetical protein
MNDILQRDHRTVRGTIRYTSKKPDRMDQERGREYFTINVHSDGKRTCIAHCEIDDRPSVMRDITYSLDEDWYPMDCFVRIAVNDRFMGSGWFRFGPDYAECETYTALDGRVTQRMQTTGRLMTFQNHAIVCDAWHMRLFDRSKAGQGVQSIDEMLLRGQCYFGSGSVWSMLARKISTLRRATSTRYISVLYRLPACRKRIHRTTSGVQMTAISCFCAGTLAVICRLFTNW